MANLFRALWSGSGWWQKLFRNTFWLTLSEITTRLLKAAQIFLIVRYLGPRSYGGFAFAFSFVAIFGIIFDSGLVLGLTRDWSKGVESEAVIGDAVALKLVLGTAACLIILVAGRLTVADVSVRAMIMLFAANLFATEYMNLASAIFRSRQRLEYEFVLRVCQAVLMFGAVVGVLRWAPSAPNVCAAYLVSSLVVLALALLAPGRQIRLRLAFDWPVWRRLLRLGIPLAMVGALGTLYTNIDSVILGWWKGMTTVGWYDAADRVTGFAVVPMSLLWLASLPAFAAGASNLDAAFRRRWELWTSAMVALAFLMGITLWAEAESIIHFLYGNAFGAAAPVLQLLGIALVIQYLYTPSYQALLVFDHQRHMLRGLAMALGVNVVLNVALIPRFSLYGAAIAAVGTHGFILVAFAYMTQKLTPIAPFNRPTIITIASCALAGVPAFAFMKLTGSNLLFSAPVGGIIYAACLVGLMWLSKGPIELSKFSWSST